MTRTAMFRSARWSKMRQLSLYAFIASMDSSVAVEEVPSRDKVLPVFDINNANNPHDMMLPGGLGGAVSVGPAPGIVIDDDVHDP